MTMKTIFKINAFAIGLAMVWAGCEPVEKNNPVPNSNSSNLSSKFLFVNASPDAPALDFYVNNIKTESGLKLGAASSYATIPMTMNSVTSNTNFHVKADSGVIGGLLGSNDLIFRAGTTNVNNFQAVSGGYYTVIVVDTIKRPKPLRTSNKAGFGDITYYAPATSVHGKSLANVDTVIQLSPDFNNSLVDYNFCLSRQVSPSFFVALGTTNANGAPGNPVPFGCTDPGGPRFVIISDYLPSPATSPVWPTPTAGKFAARFINVSPDAGTASCKINAATVGGQTTNPMLASAAFTVAVGSRNGVTVNFSNDVTTAGSYTADVTVGASTYSSAPFAFASKGSYTVILSGSKAKGTLTVTVVRNK